MRALLSVYDKTGIVELGRELLNLGYELVSTGGTLSTLRDAGLTATSVADVIGFPEILDGRVKTLHPRIHGGLLARRDDPTHLEQLRQHDIQTIDLLAGNLYPFAATIGNPNVALTDAIEQIDVGGPAMIRAAAKNFAGVVVLVDPDDYGSTITQLRSGDVASEVRRKLSAKAFAHVAAYDTLIADFLRGDSADKAPFPTEISFAGKKALDVRYGENAQQRAAAYYRQSAGSGVLGVLDAHKLQGPELSFNNLLDADAAWNAVRRFQEPTVAIVKHTIPCGLASRAELADAYDAALAGDPVSAFGGIVALNRPVDGETADRMSRMVFHVMIAPSFDEAAIAALGRKKQLRLLEIPVGAGAIEPERPAWDVRPIRGGFLVQDADEREDDPSDWRVVTRREPTDQEWQNLRYAWAAVRHVKSNAIVLAREQAVIGVGAGQPNRLESVRLAVSKAGERAAGSALASDAYFPFADGLETAIAAGVTAAAQPGGSLRDEEVIAAADAAGIAMVFTGIRHFRH